MAIEIRDDSHSPVKHPRQIFDSVFAFPPNRDTLGGTAYLILEKDESGRDVNLLIDSPAWDAATEKFLTEHQGVRWLFMTHRGGIGQVKALQQAFGCEVVIQEQEAYLLPNLDCTTFYSTIEFDAHRQGFWTPGHSPGSACLYYRKYGGVLFSGRHLLPGKTGEPQPLRTSKTFHWPRQLQNVRQVLDKFTPDSLNYICPGANTGFLRGKRAIPNAYTALQQLDLDAYEVVEPMV